MAAGLVRLITARRTGTVFTCLVATLTGPFISATLFTLLLTFTIRSGAGLLLATAGHRWSCRPESRSLAFVVFFNLFRPGLFFLFTQLRIFPGRFGRFVGVFFQHIAWFPLIALDDHIRDLIPDVFLGLLGKFVYFLLFGLGGIACIGKSFLVPCALQFHPAPIGVFTFLYLFAGFVSFAGSGLVVLGLYSTGDAERENHGQEKNVLSAVHGHICSGLRQEAGKDVRVIQMTGNTRH